MAQLPSAFNANDHEGMQDYSAMPAGEYEAEIVESEKKEARNNGNFYWKLTHQIINGKYKGRKVWTNLNLINSNAQAVEIANNELATICRACGKVSVDNTTDLHKIPHKIVLKVTPATAQFAESNKITNYKPMEGVAKPSAPAGESEPAPEEPKKKPWE